VDGGRRNAAAARDGVGVVHVGLVCHRRRSERARAALLGTTALVAASALLTDRANAQSTWQPSTSNYRNAGNWNNGTPPLTATQSAIFSGSGNTAINVTTGPGPIAPDSWTFTTNAQNYTFSGADVNFNVAGPGGGIISNANAGQIITIKNSIGESVTGVTIEVLGASTLVLSGTNTYGGGTIVLGGTIQATNNSSFGTGLITLDAATLKGDGVHNINIGNPIGVNNVSAPTSTIDNNGKKLTLSGNILGAGGLNFIDATGSFFTPGTPGRTVLSGVNTYTGGTAIFGTIVQANNDSAFGSGDVTLDFGAVQTKGSNLTLSNNFILANTVTFGGFSGGFLDANGATLRITGNITGAGALETVDSTGGSNAVILTGTNSYTGGTIVCLCSILQIGRNNVQGSIIGPIDNLGTLKFVNADTSGITTLKNEGGALTVFSNKTNAATMTIDNLFDSFGPSTLRFRDSASAGNATIINYADSFFFSPFGSTVAFFDNSTADKATINNIAAFFGSGKIKFNDSSTAGTATIANAGFGNVIFADQSTAGFATIYNNDAGVLTFKNHSSADNATIVNSADALFGGVEFLNHSTAGNAFITTNAGSATLFFDHSDGGTARFETASGGIVDFSQTTGPAGDGKITAGSIAGAGDYYLGGNQLTVGGNNLSTMVSGIIHDGLSPLTCGCVPPSSGASLVKVGTGTLILSGANTYTGGTTILGGVLQIGDGGATGSILGDVLDNATLAFNRSDTTTFGGVISGSGVVQQNGPGTTVFTAADIYTGGTTINAGTLQLGPGGSLAPTGALTVNLGGTFDLNGHTQTVGDFSGAGNVLLGAGTLTAGTTNATIFSGVMSGTGGFVKVGAGTLTLTGTNTYAGPTTVDAGKLVVNGSIANSATTINAGATLGGTGTVGPLTINGGTLSPGNSPGTITVVGNLAFVGAGNYLVEVSGASIDRTNVTGSAALAGAVSATVLPGGVLPGHYTILSAAGGRSGTFGSFAISNLPATLSASLSYTPTDAVLNLSSAFTQLSGLNRNQSAVASSLDATFNAGAAVPSNFATLFGLPPSSIPGVLSQLSGEIGTAATTAAFQTMDQFLAVMLDPFLETRLADGTVQGRALAFAPESSIQAALPAELLGYNSIVTKAPPMVAPDRRWTVWGAAYGGSGRFSGNAVIGSNDLKISTGSFAAGIDYRVSPDTVLGMAVAGGAYTYGLDALGSGRGDVVQAGLYGSTRFAANAYLSAALAFGRHDLSTDRTVAFGGLMDRLSADLRANSFGGRIESGYRFALMNGLGVTPFAALQTQRFDAPAYGERDLGGLGLAGFALNYAARATIDTRSELGARFDHRAPVYGALLILRARAAWGHEFSTERSIDAAFQALPGFGFTVIGAAQAADVALMSAGAELKFRNGVSLAAKFDGEFSGRTQVYAGTGALRVNW
jgi:autotransporter-associated beta strand protein